jgi:uncharacterized protein
MPRRPGRDRAGPGRLWPERHPSPTFLAWGKADAVGACLDRTLAVLAALASEALHVATQAPPPAFAPFLDEVHPASPPIEASRRLRPDASRLAAAFTRRVLPSSRPATPGRPRLTVPMPWISSFPEINVRTYVTVGGKPGIYFFSLDAESRLAVAAARRLYRLPYFRARMQIRHDRTGLRYTSVRTSADAPAPAEFRAAYRPVGTPFNADQGSLDAWLTERYCLYTLDDQRRVMRGEIHHPPWKLQHAQARIEKNTMGEQVGAELDDPPLLHYAARQDVLFWPLELA